MPTCLKNIQLLFFISIHPQVLAQSLDSDLLTLRFANQAFVFAKVELAITDDQKSKGLMFRKKLEKNHGMLFVNQTPMTTCMWMKNTSVPLSVAFINQDGLIENIEQMDPHTTNSHCSISPVKYALEMNQTWFADRKILVKSTVSGLPK